MYPYIDDALPEYKN